MPAAAPRTLADQLRGWSDEQLARLLHERPDLASPAPQDTSQLASRAGTRASVLRAVDHLSLLELTVLDAVVALGGVTGTDRLVRSVHADAGAVAQAVDRLRHLALLWGAEDALRAPSVVSEVVGTRLSRLGSSATTLLAGYGPARVASLARQLGLVPSGNRPDDVAAVSAALADPVVVAGLLTELDDQARSILGHLEREGRDGSVESTDPSTRRGPDDGPVAQLLARGLLVARDRRHVAVPREVAICLRAGRTTRDRVDLVPEPVTTTRDQHLVDRTAAGAAFETVRHVELLLDHWGITPPPALRSGGLGVRDLRATAELLHLGQGVAALLVEVARAARLVAVGPGPDGDPAWLPTDAADSWAATGTGRRWAALATAWLDSPRLTGLIGGRDNNKPVNALSPDLERGWLVAARRSVLAALAELPAGSVLAAGTGVPSLVERLSWQRPRRPAGHDSAVAWVVEESAALGVTALGGLSGHGRALLEDEPDGAAPAVLEPLLPPAVNHVLLQADLTAVAPGPLEQDLARRLALVADVESRGGATVYRFGAASVRRAFDSGWSAAEVHEFVASSSRTPVPQALTYLVDDVARRFGTVRAGAVESFLRSDDEAALTALVHDPRAAGLRLRRIAPTVVVSDVPLDVMLPRLRELGAAPVVEAPDGSLRTARRESLRARTPRVAGHDGHGDARASARLGARVAATVTAIRAGDRAAALRPEPSLRAAEPTTPAATLAVLREAVETKGSVWIGYVDSHGSSVERVVDPVSVEAGWLSAYDHRTEDVRSFAVHRITAVRTVTDP